MSFIAIIMTPSIVFRQKLRESVRKNYCPVSIQMHLTFIYVILLNQTGMIAMFWLEHILIKRLFTSLALLFNLSLRGVRAQDNYS